MSEVEWEIVIPVGTLAYLKISSERGRHEAWHVTNWTSVLDRQIIKWSDTMQIIADPSAMPYASAESLGTYLPSLFRPVMRVFGPFMDAAPCYHQQPAGNSAALPHSAQPAAAAVVAAVRNPPAVLETVHSACCSRYHSPVLVRLAVCTVVACARRNSRSHALLLCPVTAHRWGREWLL